MSYKLILSEIESFLDSSNFSLDLAIESISSSKRIFIAGAGRSGLVGRFFGMRLMHLGFESFIVGETTTPKIKEKDLLIAISNSGKTASIVNFAKRAKESNAKVLAITSSETSPLSDYANSILLLNGDISKESKKALPLGSLFELSSLIALESVVAALMERLSLSEESLKANHTNLE